MGSPSLTTIVVALLHLAAAEKCAAPPLNLPLRNVSVTPGTFHIGIPLQIGSTWQSIALVPSLQIDDVFLPRYSNSCIYDAPVNTMVPLTNRTSHDAASGLLSRDAASGILTSGEGSGLAQAMDGSWWAKCAEIYGGAYDPGLSTSFVENRTNNQDFHYFTDIWRFDDYLDVYTTTTQALPAKNNLTSTFLVAEKGKTFGGYGGALLGLTPNSTLLESLKNADMVPSTSWSLTSSTLCLGCIDAGASTGPWHTFHPSDKYVNPDLPCLIKAKVEALNWHPSADVEGATLIEDAFTACIDPGVKFLVLPPNVTGSFEDIVKRNVSAEYNDYIVFSGVPGNETGILTFRIEGGLEVNVTVDGVGETGAQQMKDGNWTVPIGKGGWGAYGNQTWVLGKPFTDQILLRWDATKKEYGIANRNHDPAQKSDIQPLGCDAFPKIEKAITTTPGTGILVGSIIGGFVGGLAFAAAGFWFFKRGQDGVKSKYGHLDEDTVPMQRLMSSGRESWKTTGTWNTSPPPSVHGSLMVPRTRDARPGAQHGIGLEIPGTQLYEAPQDLGRSEM
jgi:hypothetical protein